MQGLLKIGFTTRQPNDRIKELSSHTGVPGKFSLVKAWEVDNPASVEKSVFSVLRKYRAEGEFFAISIDDAEEQIIEILQKLGQADSSGITIPQKIRDAARQKEAEKIKTRQEEIQNCSKSWQENLNQIRLLAVKVADAKIGYTYAQLDALIKKCELSDSISTPAFFLTLGLSLIVEAKLEEKKGRQKWVDLQWKWIRYFEDEMKKQKDTWWEINKGYKPSVRGSIEWWAFYKDTKL
jgi:hypothetical protein